MRTNKKTQFECLYCVLEHYPSNFNNYLDLELNFFPDYPGYYVKNTIYISSYFPSVYLNLSLSGLMVVKHSLNVCINTMHIKYV